MCPLYEYSHRFFFFDNLISLNIHAKKIKIRCAIDNCIINHFQVASQCNTMKLNFDDFVGHKYVDTYYVSSYTY